jgi:hypothetical protein
MRDSITFSRKDWGEPQKTSVKMVGVRTEAGRGYPFIFKDLTKLLVFLLQISFSYLSYFQI